jgi:hypothetical protein
MLTLEIQGLAWDRHDNVAELNRLMRPREISDTRGKDFNRSPTRLADSAND